MRREIVLSVAQGKRLIAKGVAAHPVVQRALKEAKILICAGTTNTYVLEEILGRPIPHFSFTTGMTTRGVKPEIPESMKRSTAVLIDRGTPDFDHSVDELVGSLGVGDVFLKGCNALNYPEQVAGLLIGHPTGGTIGATLGTLISRKVHIMIPAGLEKCIPFDILDIARAQFTDHDVQARSVFPFTGDIITEIEAIELLAGAEAYQMASGGILGAQGASWLGIEGPAEAVDTALELCESIADEPPFGMRKA